MKKIVISGYYGFKNFGDEAILSLLINKLQNEDVTVISSNPEYTKSLYRNIKSIKTFDFINIIKEISASDILISGGGSLLQDVTSIKSHFYYLLVILTALIFKKDVIIFAQGIGPINSKIGQLLTKTLLKKCQYVSVRDEKSFELLKTWGIKSELLCDPIFSLDIPNTEKENTLAIQLRDFKTVTDGFLDNLADFVCRNFSDYNIKIYSLQDRIDLKTCYKFEQKLKQIKADLKTEICCDLTNNEIIKELSKAKYVIAMRFHAIITALLAQSQIWAINYDIKVEKLAAEFNIPIINLSENKIDYSIAPQNLSERKTILETKKFDWSGFEKIINK